MAYPLFQFAQCLLAAVGGNSSRVAFPSQPNYSAVVAPFNLDNPVTPAAVAFPANATQVSALVGCAVKANYRVQPRSGGHSAGNYGSSTGELSINLANLQSFSMDPTTHIAKVGPGLRLGAIDVLMYNAGQRFIPHGSSGTVGIGGHGTVGGAGYAWRKYGLTIDYIREVEIVLANATITRASATRNPDLFWAVRGAGASFGIVTEYVFDTLPAPPQTVSFAYFWTSPNVTARAAVYKAWQAWSSSPDLPVEVQSIVGVSSTAIFMSGAFFGSLDAYNALNVPSFFPPAQGGSVELYTNYLTLSQLWAAQTTATGRDDPAYYYLKSLILRPATRIPDPVVDQIFAYVATVDSGTNGTDTWDMEFQAGGGYDLSVPATATAFPHRDATFVVLLYVTTPGPISRTSTRFLDGLHTLFKSGHPTEYYGEYLGFVDTKAVPAEARKRYWGENLPRLGRVKAKWDPRDLFHNRQGVLPNGVPVRV
ncbi:hypothetical protein B0T22DRAFT_433899 [Podospora appendiculata]|uniref:FAD-binding PCMH-type domain-containing protein n=1 Tax=Podospora appendiculata TaxID=314037 RepID=A0AAE1C7J6_9PEZI|nr:hypothetical protein B0T22DRAFT_433899 [Podospora appendiculata]